MVQFVGYNPSLISVCQHTFMFVSLFPLPPHEIHTTYFNFNPSVTSTEVKEFYIHAAYSLPSVTPGTHGLTCLLIRQGKNVWLVVRQLSIKSGWVNRPLIHQDLSKAIFLNIARNTDTSSGYHLPPAQNPPLNTSPPPLTNTYFLEIDITPTATSTITATTTTTNSPTKIPAVMSINNSLPPRFCMPFSHTSSVTTSLSLSIPYIPVFSQMLQKLKQLGLSGEPHYTNNSQKKSP